MELKRLVKNTSPLFVTRIFLFFTGLIRAKINAIILGTSGVGVVSQVDFLSQKLNQLTTLGMNDAVVKQIAENQKSTEIINTSLKAYIILVFLFIIIFLPFLLIYSKSLSFFLFGNHVFFQYYYYSIICFPILILNSIPFAILKGFKLIKSIAKARVFIIISNLLVFLPLVLLFKLKGAIIFLPISLLLTFSINLIFVQKNKSSTFSLKGIIRAPLKKNLVKEQLMFSGVNLIKGPFIIFAEFFTRSLVVTNLGIEKLGVYSPIITFSSIFTGFLLPAFNTYLYSRYCETTTNKEINGILNDGIRLGSFTLIPLLFLGIPFREFIIKLIYSSEFLEATLYLPYHFIGIVFYVWFFSLAMVLTPKNYIIWNAIFLILLSTIQILVVYILIENLGLYAWMLKHIIGNIIIFFIISIFLYKKFLFKYTKENFKLMSYLISGAIIIILLEKIINVYTSYATGLILFIISYKILHKNEQKIIKESINNVFNKYHKK